MEFDDMCYMMNREPFEVMLTGGHPNSLGRTIEVVEIDQASTQSVKTLTNYRFGAKMVPKWNRFVLGDTIWQR